MYTEVFVQFAGTAHKDCEANGEWFRHPENNRTWSNYTTCVNIPDFQVQHFALAVTHYRLYYMCCRG